MDINGTVAELEARLAELVQALGDVRRQVDGFVCPASHANHEHTPDGGCVCPVCGVVLPARIAVDYRERHLRARHEVCPDCGRQFVGLAGHRVKAHPDSGREREVCPDCGRLFIALAGHRRRAHPPPLLPRPLRDLRAVSAGMRERGYQ